MHAVTSSTSFHFTHLYLSNLTTRENFDTFVDRCPHIKILGVNIYSSDLASTISPAVSRWPKLQEVICSNVALNMDAISYLSSLSNLRRLEFKTEIDSTQGISHLDSKLVFSNLTNVNIKSRSLDAIASLLRFYIRLPAIKSLYVNTSWYISRPAIQACLAAILRFYPG